MAKSAKPHPLEREMATYEASLTRLIDRHGEGKHVVIKGEQIVGVRREWKDALKLGYRKLGLEPFLVRKITRTPEVIFMPTIFPVHHR